MSDTSQSDSKIIRPEWIRLLIKQSECEAEETKGLKLVQEDVRRVLWNLATSLGFKSNGVPARACRILERYFYFLFKPYVKNPRAIREKLLKDVQNRFMIIIACCIQLSAKMLSANSYISPAVIRVALVCKGFSCTVKDIKKTETEIFSVIGFRIPLWTSVELGEWLAQEIEMSNDLFAEIARTVDMAEYLRNNVDNKMQCSAATGNSTPSLFLNGVTTLHLSAASVALVTKLGCFSDIQSTTARTPSTYLAELAALVDVPLAFLNTVADIIYAAIRVEHQIKCTPLILKRKRNN